MLTASQAFIIFGILSLAAGEDNFDDKVFLRSFDEDYDYSSLTPVILYLKKKCIKYPDAFPCQYKSSLDNELRKDASTSLFDELSNEITLTNNTGPFGNADIPEEILSEAHIEKPERRLQKRFTTFRRRYPQINGYKRGPGFRSWGGKRNYNYNEKAIQKRSKFTSWGGKRSEEGVWNDSLDSNFDGNELTDKRSKFVSWGGKRNDDFEEKRSKFRSWGGRKRAENLIDEIVKRDKENPISYDYSEKRGPSWEYKDILEEPFKDHVPKRPQFQSWGGKRSTQSWYGPLRLYFYPNLPQKYKINKLVGSEEKRKFSSWGGKRNEETNSFIDTEKNNMNNDRF